MDNISTGIKGFDNIMGGLYPGDNVVWQVEDINNYKYENYLFCKTIKISKYPKMMESASISICNQKGGVGKLPSQVICRLLA